MPSVSYLAPGAYSWVVPGRVHFVTIDTYGAGYRVDVGGGLWAYPGIRSVQAVSPGEILRVRVGGSPYAPVPGYNGGGAGHNYGIQPFYAGDIEATTVGYGASDVRRGGDTEAHRVQTAAGGGGLGLTYLPEYEVDYGNGWMPYGWPPPPTLPLFPLEATIMQASSSASGSSGGDDGAPGYPAALGGYFTDTDLFGPNPTDRVSLPGAGGGGQSGGDGGVVWRGTALTPGGPPPWAWREFYYSPTSGHPGTFYSAAPTDGVERPDGDTLVLFKEDGRVDIQWDTPENQGGWSLGSINWNPW